MQKKWTMAGSILWIAGLILFISGLNIEGDIRAWLTTIGSIAFLIGLGITGAVWLKKKNGTEQ